MPPANHIVPLAVTAHPGTLFVIKETSAAAARPHLTKRGSIMKKGKTLNFCLLLAVLVVLGVCAFYVRVGATADSVVVLKTSGMTCSSCSEKIAKALQNVHGVAATEVDLQGGWVIAGYDSKQVRPEKLARCVVETGYPSSVERVLTPEQFRKIIGRDVGTQGGGSGCCGSQGCSGK